MTGVTRKAEIERTTKETDIRCTLVLHDEAPASSSVSAVTCVVDTGIGFLDHMIEAFSRHGGFSIALTCKGDLHIDQHHTVEDAGIVLGQAFAHALGDMRGIERFGLMECPLDEALVKAVVDLSGRPYLHYGVTYKRPFIGALDSSLLREFLGGLVLHAKWTVHVDALRGENDHHVAEAMFKALARAVRQAVRTDGSGSISFPPKAFSYENSRLADLHRVSGHRSSRRPQRASAARQARVGAHRAPRPHGAARGLCGVRREVGARGRPQRRVR